MLGLVSAWMSDCHETENGMEKNENLFITFLFYCGIP